MRLAAFQPRLRVRERRHPKLYWIDPGLVRAVKKLHGPITPEERGVLLEGWDLHLLRTHAEEGALFDCRCTGGRRRCMRRFGPEMKRDSQGTWTRERIPMG